MRKYSRLLSAAVMIGTLRVNHSVIVKLLKDFKKPHLKQTALRS